MEKSVSYSYILFLIAQIVTFTFITLLQLAPKRFFIMFLIIMHGGIALFIISKKCFIRKNKSIKHFYMISYILLALYIPILLYKLISTWCLFDFNVNLVRYTTISVTIVSLITSVYNSLKLYKYLTL